MTNFRKWRPWPRTLSMQLILVTAAAVLLSNAAVAYWFEYGSEKQFQQQFQSNSIDRAVGRTAQLVNALSGIQSETRDTVVRIARQRDFSFTYNIGKVPSRVMNEDEKNLAARVTENLRPELQKYPVAASHATVDLRNYRSVFGNPQGGGRGNNGQINFQGPGRGNTGNGPNNTQGGGRGNNGGGNFGGPPGGGRGDTGPQMADVVELAVQIDDQSYLSARVTQRDFSDTNPFWSLENQIATVLSILVAAGGAALLSRRMSKPLGKLTAAASEVAKGGAAPRVPEEGPEDVRRAAVAFNAMTDQVQRTLANQRQLLTAVGHDLRTPITAMRLSLEFMDDGETREDLEKNLNELQQLTEAVLSSAKGAGGEKKRNVDLATLLDSLCADLEESGKSVTWQSHGPAPLFCRTNEITRAARNLIENALAYGHVARVRLEDTKDQYEIVVDDDGPGIPATDRERVFEPFVRLETSRNLSTGGTGLGLTLVKAIAEGHGGSVVLENRPEGGLRVRLCLPRNTARA